jgi:diguanylate cyclase (GGDEF)-like protein
LTNAEPASGAAEPRVLAVDDDEALLAALGAVIDRTGAQVQCARSGEEALEILADPEAQFAAVLLDVGLPGIDGFDVARRIKATAGRQHLPVIFLTGHIDEAAVRRGYAVGAIDYLLKPVDPDVLEAKLRAFLDLARLRRETAVLTHRSLHDPLTGLPNRTLFLDRLEHALMRLERTPAMVGVLFLDLDDFKDTNDRLGHDEGDRLLVDAGRRIQSAIRAVDTAARFGGDEFLVLCEQLDDAETLERLAERVADALDLGASIGWAWTDDPTASSEELIHEADLAMLRTKSKRRVRAR